MLAAFPITIFFVDEVYRRYQLYIDSLSPLLKFSGFAYGILLGIIAYRLFFNYALWTFPSVELTNERDVASKHRSFWFKVVSTVLFGAIGYLLYRR